MGRVLRRIAITLALSTAASVVVVFSTEKVFGVESPRSTFAAIPVTAVTTVEAFMAYLRRRRPPELHQIVSDAINQGLSSKLAEIEVNLTDAQLEQLGKAIASFSHHIPPSHSVDVDSVNVDPPGDPWSEESSSPWEIDWTGPLL